MIAASEPQEYIPRGRQQAARHPGVREVLLKKSPNENDDFVLNKLEKVSLVDAAPTEWWTLRKAGCDTITKISFQEPDQVEFTQKSFTQCMSVKSENSDILDESVSFKSLNETNFNKFGKRLSDTNLSKSIHKRLSVENDQRGASKNTDATKAQTDFPNTNLPLKAKLDPAYTEEELYVRGNTVVWSYGLVNNFDGLDNCRKTIACYTLDNPVKQALWCNFHCERPVFDEKAAAKCNNDKRTVNSIEAICATDSQTIKVFTPKGEDFTIAIPFHINKIWNTKYGVLIEKDNQSFPKESLYQTATSIFSLSYPLDDICPVALNHSGVWTSEFNNLQVVFTSNTPSICVMYDTNTKQHSVYSIRKLKAEEMQISSSQSFKSKSRSLLKENLSTHRGFNAFLNPLSMKMANSPSLVHVHYSRSHSSMALMSRCQSPGSSYTGSPMLLCDKSKLNANPPKTPDTSRSFFDQSKTVSYLKAPPNICLDLLWTDNYTQQDPYTAGPASKVFLTQDFVDQWYLCYMLPSRNQLSVVKIDFSSANNINFGVATSISAKDAISIQQPHMLAILEHSGNVCLYSGLTIVGKLHIGGTLAQHTPSPYVRRNMPNLNFSPFPRRSSLLPHLKPTDAAFDEHLLSPVLPATSNVLKTPRFTYEAYASGDYHKANLNGLIDAIQNRLTLKYSDGTFYRITLPSMALTKLVERCLNTLCQILPKDIAITLLCRWYAMRNVIGAEDMTHNQEWGMFENLLYELLGYEDDQGSESSSKEVPKTPCAATKRQKYSAGTDQDWNYLISSNHTNAVHQQLHQLLNLKQITETCATKSQNQEDTSASVINPKSVLFPYIRLVHFALHLLYEDLKLNVLHCDDLVLLGNYLRRIATDLELDKYVLHYWKDFPEQAVLIKNTVVPTKELSSICTLPIITNEPVDIMSHISGLLDQKDLKPYPYLVNVNNRSKNILQLCGLLSHCNQNETPTVFLDSFVKEFSTSGAELSVTDITQTKKKLPFDSSSIEQVVLLMVEMKINTSYLDTLPFGIYFLLYNALWQFRENPPSDWPAEAYYLLWRDDLAAQALKMEKEKQESSQELLGMYSSTQLEDVMPGIKTDSEQIDGMEDIDNSLMKLRFNEDVRVNEARKMLQSSKPVPIVLTQRSDESDHEFIEVQEKHLYGICIRTMALPVGRGMFTLRTATPVITEPLPAPPLCLTGKAPPRGTTIDLNHIDTPTNMNLWPIFHNGVANGLRITPDAHNIDNTWIILNKAKGGNDLQIEHAGFLLALGLNGHLKNLAFNSTFNYLEKIHEMTSVGILLGLAAAFRGTSHPNLTKTLAIHIEALLPPTSMELDIPQTLQVASLLGVGLLYQGTAHWHMTEVLLSEIGRPPGPEMENSVDRESYSLAAGLALGLVTLKHGTQPTGLSDLSVPDTLYYYMVGGNRRPLTGSQEDKYKTPSFQIREGSTVNLDVTAPGATLALGLMYLGTSNKAVADWMAPPETQYLLDFVRPDFLLLRVLSRSLILWSDIRPTKEWVEGQVPQTIKLYSMVEPNHSLDIDYEAMNQAYCNIIAGACFALGLRYAGTADREAFETLLYYCHLFTSLTAKSIAELAGKSTIETCLNVLLLSSSMVMAGTGNLEIMRLVRHLRRRVGTSNSPVVTYGSHLATHMALGLLFLGGGRYTLSNSPASVAALVCAFYPKFPTHSNDNRYHLQAFRHLYVLAVEPRLLIPKEIHLDEMCYANIKIVKLDGAVLNIKGPGIIPDPNTLMRVAVDDERYWPVVFERDRNWELLEKILSTTGYIEVKQRAGCLSYIADKFGYHSELARTLTHSAVVPWDPSPNSVIHFTSDKSIKLFCKHYLISEKAEYSQLEAKLRQALCKITYDAVVKDKIIILVVFMSLIKAITDLDTSPDTYSMWQFKIIAKQILSRKSSVLISKDIVLSLRQEILGILSTWDGILEDVLKKYILGKKFTESNDDISLMKKLATYVIFYDLPHNVDVSNNGGYVEMFTKLHGLNLDSETIKIVAKLFDIR